MVAFSSTDPANSNEGKFPQPPSAAHTCATAGTQASGPYVPLLQGQSKPSNQQRHRGEDRAACSELRQLGQRHG